MPTQTGDWFADNAPPTAAPSAPAANTTPSTGDWFADNAPPSEKPPLNKDVWTPQEGQPGITRTPPVALNPKFNPNIPSREETGGTSPTEELKKFR